MLLFEIIIYSTFEYVDMAVSLAIDSISAKKKLSDSVIIFSFSSALRELLSNAIEHGNNMIAEKKVFCKISCSTNQLRIEVRDEGKGFSLKKVFCENTQKDILRERGRGLSIISKLGFKLDVNGNLVTAKLKLTDISNKCY